MQVRLLILLFKAFRLISRRLPLGFVLNTSAKLGQKIGRRHERDLDVARAQLELVFPTMAANEIEDLIDQMFAHFGESIGETLVIEKLLKQNAVLSSEEADLLFSRHAGRKSSAFLLSAHIGNFELLAAYLASRGLPLSVIGRMPNFEILSKLLIALRRSYPVDVMWREDPKVSYMILKLLKQNTSLALLVDQDADLGNDFIEFFGVKACTPSALIRFAMKHQKALYCTMIVREEKMKHRFICKEIPYLDDSDEEVRKVLVTYNRYVEEAIRQYPEQWPWWHRRWRRRPGVDYSKHPEQLPSRKAYLKWLAELKKQANE